MKSCQVVDKTRGEKKKKGSSCPGNVGGLGLGNSDSQAASGTKSPPFLFLLLVPPVPARSVSTLPTLCFLPTSRHSRRSRSGESGSAVRRGRLLLLACFKNSERDA